jgi:hypothetical protein
VKPFVFLVVWKYPKILNLQQCNLTKKKQRNQAVTEITTEFGGFARQILGISL